MGFESPINILFDSNGVEMAYSQSQALTGSTTGYMVMGSGSSGATFLKVGPSGELFITGSIATAASPSNVNQGNSGSINQSWYVSLTDGLNVIGTGSSAPVYVNVVNPLTTSVNTSTTTTVSQVLASVTNYNMLSLNSSRKGATFYKEGGGFAYLLLGSGTASSINFSIKLASNAYYDLPYNYVGPVNIVFSSTAGGASNFVLVTDFA